MRHFELIQVDVFTDRPLEGNPLAVFPDAQGLSDEEMQRIAREMNLSETTFVLPPSDDRADYRVRIFTPVGEIPFAGHPTLGTAHVMTERGKRAALGETFTLRQETLAGVQPIDVVPAEGGEASYTMTQPIPTFAGAPPTAAFADALRVQKDAIVGEPRRVAVGIGWHIVELDGVARVRDLRPDMDALARMERETRVGTTVFSLEAEDPDCRVRVRSFAPAAGVPEDPVCGSGNGCVAAYLAETGRLDAPFAYTAEQGSEVGRPGRVQARVDRAPSEQGAPSADDAQRWRVRVGGRAVTLIRGELALSSRPLP